MSSQSIDKQIRTFCERIGSDPLLVQGAGGNISWKDGHTLWVKASGTWLAHAMAKTIFVPVDLEHLRHAMARRDYGVTPRVLNGSGLRPSIETLLHALMPHALVVHVHAVDILARLVRVSGVEEIRSLVGDALRCATIDYFKPGPDLAAEIAATLRATPGVDVLFLQNHGVVMGGKDVAELEGVLNCLSRVFVLDRRVPEMTVDVPVPGSLSIVSGYQLVANPVINALARDDRLYNWVQTCWALYPDHVVFLGAKPACYTSSDEFRLASTCWDAPPDFAFVRGIGVFELGRQSEAKIAQLQCYVEVLTRQTDQHQLQVLSDKQIAQLLEWDAEEYRLNISC